MFHLIMQFIPAFPFYFMLRSVCRQWLSEFQDHIYANVDHLSLVDDGKPKYYFRMDNGGQRSLVQFKPIAYIGTNVQLTDHSLDDSLNIDKTCLFEKLANLFPNVKRLRLGLSSLELPHFEQCVKTMLPKFTQLETLDILGTVNYSSRNLYQSVQAGRKLEMIVCSLSSSTRNLNLIGISFDDTDDALGRLKMFSDKGRRAMAESMSLPSTLQNNAPSVNIQKLSVSYLFLDQMSVRFNINDWESIQEMYSHFDVSVVEYYQHSSILPVESYVDYLDYISKKEEVVCNQHSSSLPVEESYFDYLNYMSKKEQVVLSHMGHIIRRNSDEIIQAVIDITVREYSLFQPLCSLSTATKVVFQLASRTILKSMFVLQHIFWPSTLRLLTDPSRMRYPELVFNIDSTVGSGYLLSSLLQRLISRCLIVQMLDVIKTTIDTYKVPMAINGVQNYLVSAIAYLPFSPLRTDLMKYLLSKNPELITLGDLNGIIRDDQKDCPIIQMLLSQSYSEECLEDIKFLVSAGASLTQADKNGNNVLHSACRMVDINLLEYLASVCPESLMFERNNKGETPIELIFSGNSHDGDVQLLFLRKVVNLPFFNDETLKDYQTSLSALLKIASDSPHLETIQLLLKNGLDTNVE